MLQIMPVQQQFIHKLIRTGSVAESTVFVTSVKHDCCESIGSYICGGIKWISIIVQYAYVYYLRVHTLILTPSTFLMVCLPCTEWKILMVVQFSVLYWPSTVWLYQKIPCCNSYCIVSNISVHRRMSYPVRL